MDFIGLCIMFAVATVTAEEGYFWHVTDFHWDFSYWGGQLSCNGMNISQPGKFGNQWCDSPWRLVQETIGGMSKLKQEVDFILWTGDTVPHVADTYLSLSKNEELVRNITHLMKAAFPHVPTYATFGNHDHFPSDQVPSYGHKIYNATYALWKTWINDATQEHYFLKGGYYTVLIRPGLRIVALNTNMYYTHNLATGALDDPAGQFAWLDTVLAGAANCSEKVILIGHVPPGHTTPRDRVFLWMHEPFNEKFNAIIQRHSPVIAAMHFGHEHHDNFKLYYDRTGQASIVLFIAPSVTPWRYQTPIVKGPAHNPGVRLVKYDRRTGQHLDIYQYHMDLDEANAAGTVNWTLGYKATTLYGIPDVSPSSMHKLYQKMMNLNSQEFRAFINWYTTNGKKNNTCGIACHKTVICGLGNLDEKPFQKCMTSTNNTFPVSFI